MKQTDLLRVIVTVVFVIAGGLSSCYSSVDSPSGQPPKANFAPDRSTVGKGSSASDSKQWSKTIAKQTTALKDASAPVSAASWGKQPIRKAVEDAILDTASQSSTRLKVSVDPNLGTLRRFSGNLENPYGRSTQGALRYLEESLPRFGLSAGEPLSLAVTRKVVDEDGALHVIATPSIGGLPVWLTTAALHLDASGNIRSMYAENLAPALPRATVRFDANGAAAEATRAVLPFTLDGKVTTVETPALGIWPSKDAHTPSTLAWRLVQFAVEPDHTPQYFETYVNAETGEVAARFATTVHDTLTPATGTGVGTLGETESLRISYNQGAGTYVLLDQSRGTAFAEILTYNANSEYNLTLDNSTLVSSTDANKWDAAGASIHANLQKTVDYYLNTLGRNSRDGQGASIRGIAHYGQQYNNAYWSSYERQMVFGDGDGSQFLPFGGALDVVAHEFSHAVVSATANLIYANQSGALNESFADVMSIMVDRENWTEGEDAMGPYAGQDAIRSLENPELYGNPSKMSDYMDISYDNGGVHFNCGIPSHAAYLVGNREVVEKVWYRTLNQGHVGPSANFKDMAEGTLTACDELAEKGTLTQTNCDAVLKAWVDVGVLTEVSASGCPADAEEKDGLCYCKDGYAPSLTGGECVQEGSLNCPDHSIETNGQCFCEDGYRVPPSDNTDAPMTCELEENACPKNSTWDSAEKKCVCNEGFEGNPDGLDGGCSVISSDCPENSHPVWSSDRETNPEDYACYCNDGFVFDAGACAVAPGGCGNESFYGRCENGDLIYCGPDGIEIAACADSGLVCGLFDSRKGYDCLNPDGVGAAETCEAGGYQECGADNPFCVAEADADNGFCSEECKVDEDCGTAYACCGTVSDGTRACLTAPYCDNVVNTKATCDDVAGGSTYYGKCDGNVLIYCDGSTAVTQQVSCPKQGLVCRFVDEETGYNCVDQGTGAIAEPSDWCPYENDGVCDVPDLCPEGADLLDCNPCGDVTADGECDGDILRLCDSAIGLVTTDCASLSSTPTCVVDKDGKASCTAETDTDTETDADTGDTETDTTDTETTDTDADMESADTCTGDGCDASTDADTGTADSETEASSDDTASNDSENGDTEPSDTDTESKEEEKNNSVSCSCNTTGAGTHDVRALFSMLFELR